MKKALYIFSGLFLMLVIFLSFKKPVNASSYKAQVILDSYEISDDFKVGESTTIKVVFKNVDPSYNVRNILISYTSNGYTVIPTEGTSNQFFYETIRPNDSITVEMPIVVARTEGGYASMNFNVEYMSDESRWSSASYIVFPVKEEETTSIVLKNVSVPTEATAGGNILISTSFLNTSDADMFNTDFVISGDVDDGTKISRLGTVATRRNAYGEAYVTFSAAGKKHITLSIRYEDSEGETHEEVLGQYSVTVIEDTAKVNTAVTSNTNTANTGSGNQSGLSIATLLLIASGVIVFIIIVVLIVNVTRKRK